MEDGIKIRKLVPKDAEQYVRLHNKVWRHAYKHIFPEQVFLDKEAKTQIKIDDFPNWINRSPQEINYAVEIGGKIVGCMSASLCSNYDYFKKDNYAELISLYVLPEYQGAGIGSKLKKVFVDWAKENGATKYVIGVLEDNFKARKVYEKWGGKLNEYTKPFVKLNVEYKEVFYTIEL